MKAKSPGCRPGVGVGVALDVLLGLADSVALSVGDAVRVSEGLSVPVADGLIVSDPVSVGVSVPAPSLSTPQSEKWVRDAVARWPPSSMTQASAFHCEPSW